MKTIVRKLSLWKPNSFIVLCINASSLNSKFLIKRNIFPTFLTTQLDHSSPAFVLQRPWKAPKKGFIVSIILISSVTGVGVKFLPWKKKKKKEENFIWRKTSGPFFSLLNFHVYVEWKDIRVIDIWAGKKQNYLLHLLSLELQVL